MLLLTKAILAALLGFLFSTILGLVLLPILRHFNIGQRVSAFVRQTHIKKNGTPTMGGLIFIIPTLVGTIFLALTDKISYTSNLGIVLLVFFGYALIGFLDDYTSIKRENNEGLTVYQKLILQVIIALGFFYIYMRNGGATSWVVGTLGIDMEMGWLYGIFILLILVGASNAVNLTDGLDGLAGGLSAIAFVAFSLISFAVGFEDIGVFSIILTGALVGFLLFNTYPAKVFMGDTGSLAIGGIIGVAAIMIRKEFLIPIFCGVFFVESLSVLMQRVYFKYTRKRYGQGRRIWSMTPLHHHYQAKPAPAGEVIFPKPVPAQHEAKITVRFWIVGIMLAVSTLALLKLR